MSIHAPIIRISRLLPDVVRHDEAGIQFLDSPRRREAASLLLPHNRKRRTRAAAQIPIKSAVEEMISISSMALQ